MSDSSGYGVYDEETDSYLNTETNQSICPAGWRLPTDSGNKSFNNLVTAASLEAGAHGNIHTTPNWFVYGGYFIDSLERVIDEGTYWSSTVYDDCGSLQLVFYSYIDGFIDPSFGDGGRYPGASVRCVVR